MTMQNPRSQGWSGSPLYFDQPTRRRPQTMGEVGQGMVAHAAAPEAVSSPFHGLAKLGTGAIGGWMEGEYDRQNPGQAPAEPSLAQRLGAYLMNMGQPQPDPEVPINPFETWT